jgi:transposase
MVSEMLRLSAVQCAQHWQEMKDVAELFGVSASTISEIRRRHAELGTFEDRPRSGRSRVTTPEQDRH